MWLVYLRFDDQDETRTYHVTAASQKAVDRILALARQRGLTRTAQLAEHACFYAKSDIEGKDCPSLHFLTEEEFARGWERAYEV